MTVILAYHRVDEDPRDPQYLRVSPAHFDEQIALLARHHEPARLTDMAPGSVVVTFDDGYAGNLHHALPVLERHGVPATVFVATGFVSRQVPFWWELFEELLLGAASFSGGELDLLLGGIRHRWQIVDSGPVPTAAWRIGDRPTHDRQRAFGALAPALCRLSVADRAVALSQLRSYAVEQVEPDARRRPLTVDELRELAQHPLIDIGAHTVWHPPLTEIEARAARRELRQSRRWLQETLGRPIAACAYPYGAWNAAVAELARDLGFAAACTIDAERAARDADPHALPRMMAPDVPGTELQARMDAL